MAKKGRFVTGSQYAGIPQQVLNQIRANLSGTSTATPTTPTTPAATDPSTSTSPMSMKQQQRLAEAGTKKPMRMLTEQEIAADPVLSGRLTLEQARVNYLRNLIARNSAPLADLAETNPAKYQKRMKEWQAATAAIPNPAKENYFGESERLFFALGGTKNSLDENFAGAGWSDRQILEYWRSAGMEDKGREIIARRNGVDSTGAAIAGGPDTSMRVDVNPNMTGSSFTYTPQSRVSGLNALQDARLEKLRALKKSGATLSPQQLAALKKLRRLANG